MAQTFIPNLENKPHINHKDGNKVNNQIENLEWVTRSENQSHAYRLGLLKITSEQRKKANDAHRKISSNEANDIINLYSNQNLSQKQIAQIFNVAQTTISRIVRLAANNGN